MAILAKTTWEDNHSCSVQYLRPSLLHGMSPNHLSRTNSLLRPIQPLVQETWQQKNLTDKPGYVGLVCLAYIAKLYLALAVRTAVGRGLLAMFTCTVKKN